jgi:CubicO group peptidase (beta-lactamase class C family)
VKRVSCSIAAALLVLALVLLSACAHSRAYRLAEGHASAAERVDAYLGALGERGRFAGYALIARGDEPLFSRGYGARDLGTAGPATFTADTPVPIASVTKQFTAAAVLVCREKGLLALDDAVTDHLFDAGVPRGATVRHLLTHTSGVETGTTPGAEFAYSNDGYRLLGRIVATVSGVSYGEFLRVSITEPLGLTHTALAPEPHGDNGAAGLVVSSAADLLRWTRHLATAPAGSALSFDALTEHTVDAGHGVMYGYGVARREISAGGRTHTMYWHAGSMEGYGAELCYFPEHDLTVVLLARSEGVDQYRVAIDVLQLVLGAPAGERPASRGN